MKIGTPTLNDTQHEWMKIFARLIEASSGGRIKPEIYPASQLGSIPRMIEGTQFGSVQCFVGPPEFLSGVDSRFEILGAPGLFKDVDHAERTLQDPEFNKAFLALGEDKGLKGAGLFISGPAVFNTRTKVEKLTDLAGQKIRVLASPIQTEQLKRLKATAVPMPLGEVLPALQQGTIDGVMSTLQVLTALRFYDAAKFLVETNQAMVTVVSVVSKSWFGKLPADLQAAVSEAGQKASTEVHGWTKEFIAKQRAFWTASGGTITDISAAEHEELMKLLRPIGEEVTSRKPPEKALFELLQKTAQSKA
ncbi:TRAP transporter substrate-binding protein [Bosea sp. (in: a-proteobacteria)]|jgi:TRAP-type C4-dicarboxylate transport system substrate-binding protein|uniref:TRAP transporter substrate-binding protein n=1 Tax=Bosea sp. (in: a-proteobacteria) TaxID=1871050 RepID=UPI002DDCA04F|nr:TRAP transporter substrate-binding protein [Bosea sp. (in: a-proteobacteria)]HEV2508436.1 TRAP transporter substrate-binding protein [Bosea sp. (in: a-proteobacteria)]